MLTRVHYRPTFMRDRLALLYLLHVGLKKIPQALHKLGESRPLRGDSMPAIQHCLVAGEKKQGLGIRDGKGWELFFQTVSFHCCLAWSVFGLRQVQICTC